MAEKKSIGHLPVLITPADLAKGWYVTTEASASGLNLKCWTNKQASKQTNKQASKQARKQASKQASKETNKLTNKQTNKQDRSRCWRKVHKPLRTLPENLLSEDQIPLPVRRRMIHEKGWALRSETGSLRSFFKKECLRPKKTAPS